MSGSVQPAGESLDSLPSFRGGGNTEDLFAAGPSWFYNWFTRFHFLEKTFTIAFAFIVFTIIARHVRYHRDMLSYIGIMLMITTAYLEILVIRDHLWVLEGAMPDARRWRDIFFNQQSLRQMRWRKILVVLFAMAVFTYVYVKTQGSEIYSFLGIILMVTVLYFEVLAIRDEVQALVHTVRARQIEEAVLRGGNGVVSVGPADPAGQDPPPATGVDPEPDGLSPKDDEV